MENTLIDSIKNALMVLKYSQENIDKILKDVESNPTAKKYTPAELCSGIRNIINNYSSQKVENEEQLLLYIKAYNKLYQFLDVYHKLQLPNYDGLEKVLTKTV
jgi:hypothetical protein